MAEIDLVGGLTALVDDDDFEMASQYRWSRCGWQGRYVGARFQDNGRRKTIYLHRLIAQPTGDLQVDHRNGDRLDNRRSNLRIVTPAQNKQNLPRLQTNNTSGLRGVWWVARLQKWRAGVQVRRRQIHLGYFDTIGMAARAAADGRKRLMTHSVECESVS